MECEASLEEMLLVAEESQSELLGERRAGRVVRGRGEGHKNCVVFEGEDDPSDVEKCGLVADRVAEGRAVFSR